MKILEKFRGGNESHRRKLNDMVDALNRVQNMRGDGLIQVSQHAAGVGIGLSVPQLLPRIPKYQAPWTAKVIDGRDEGLAEYWYYKNVPPIVVAWYIDEVLFDANGDFSAPSYPSRTRTDANVYIPTLCRPWNFWPKQAGYRSTFRIWSSEAVLDNPDYDNYPTYMGYGPETNPQPCWAKIVSDTPTYYYEGFRVIYGQYAVRSGKGFYDYPHSSMLSIWLYPANKAAGCGRYTYPKIQVNDYIPIIPVLDQTSGKKWFAGVSYMPIHLTGGLPGANASEVRVDTAYGQHGRLWTVDLDT